MTTAWSKQTFFLKLIHLKVKVTEINGDGESDRMIFHLLAPTVSARPRQSQEAGASSVSLTWVAAVQLLGLSPAAFHRS